MTGWRNRLRLKRKSPSRGRLGEGLGTTRLHLRAEAETRPGWHDRVKGLLPAILHLSSLSPQAEDQLSLAHADVGPLGITPRINHLLLAKAGVAAIAVVGSRSSRAQGRPAENA